MLNFVTSSSVNFSYPITPIKIQQIGRRSLMESLLAGLAWRAAKIKKYTTLAQPDSLDSTTAFFFNYYYSTMAHAMYRLYRLYHIVSIVCRIQPLSAIEVPGTFGDMESWLQPISADLSALVPVVDRVLCKK